MGKDQIKISDAAVYELAKDGCTNVEIASCLGISISTLTRRCEELLARARAEGNVSLRRAQLRIMNAGEGSAAMAIFLGKQYLGQSDKTTSEVVETLTVNFD